MPRLAGQFFPREHTFACVCGSSKRKPGPEHPIPTQVVRRLWILIESQIDQVMRTDPGLRPDKVGPALGGEAPSPHPPGDAGARRACAPPGGNCRDGASRGPRHLQARGSQSQPSRRPPRPAVRSPRRGWPQLGTPVLPRPSNTRADNQREKAYRAPNPRHACRRAQPKSTKRRPPSPPPKKTTTKVESRVKGRYLVLDVKTRQLSLTQEGMLLLFGWGRGRGPGARRAAPRTAPLGPHPLLRGRRRAGHLGTGFAGNTAKPRLPVFEPQFINPRRRSPANAAPPARTC